MEFSFDVHHTWNCPSEEVPCRRHIYIYIYMVAQLCVGGV